MLGAMVGARQREQPSQPGMCAGGAGRHSLATWASVCAMCVSARAIHMRRARALHPQPPPPQPPHPPPHNHHTHTHPPPDTMALMLRSSTVRPAAGMAAPRVAMRPQLVRPVRAASNSGAEVQEKLEEVVEIAKAKWDKLEDKPSAVAVTSAGLLALVAVSAVVDTIDRIPIISDLIELVGVGVTGWFGWRFLVFGPDREELVRNVKSFLKKVYGA